MKKYYLFDLDGTLTDPKEGITQSVRYALLKMGFDVPADSLTDFIGPPLKDSFMKFLGFSSDEADTAIAFYRERYSTIGLFENEVFDDVIPVLKKLKEQGKVLAVATCKPTVFAKQICDKYGISDYMTAIVGTELVGTLTTKTTVIEQVLKELGAGRSEAIMIGDREHDIIGAKNTGLTNVGVTFGYAHDGELEAAGADYIIENLYELLSSCYN